LTITEASDTTLILIYIVMTLSNVQKILVVVCLLKSY